VVGSHWARKGVQSLRHVVSREVEAVGEELGECLVVLLTALLGARAGGGALLRVSFGVPR
jgi:hypothetical protein